LRDNDWKRCKVALIGETSSSNGSHPETAPVSTIKVNGGTSNCRRSVEERVICSPLSNGLKLIQSAYADSDTSSSTHSPSPTPKLDGSMSFNVNFNGDSQLQSPSSANGYVIDSAKASTSKVSIIGPVKTSSSGTLIDAVKQNDLKRDDFKETMKNGSSKVTRKRVLSERGEAEAKYPVIDRKTLFNSWRGSRLLQSNNRNSGVGLFNSSNDCFLNAVLQAMVHTAPLARYVAELHSCGSYSNSCFACALGEHVRRAIASSGPFKAQWIQPYLRKIFPSHKPGYQEDAHELLSLILDALDPAPPASLKQTNGTSSTTPNQFRFEYMIVFSIVLFLFSAVCCPEELRPSTPMEQMFGGALRNEIRCFACGENYINYERIRELNLGLRMRKREGIISLNDLFADYFSNETLNSFDCKKCKRKTQAQRVTRMIRAPHVLIVQLKRFNAIGCKIRLPITVEMNIKLDRFMYQIDDRNSYSLCSLIEHQGDGIDRGHYIAFVRGFDGKGWHCFDDESSEVLFLMDCVVMKDTLVVLYLTFVYVQCQRVSVDEVRKRQGYVMIYTRSEQSPENNLASCSSTLSVQQRFNNKHRFSMQSATSLVTTALSRFFLIPYEFIMTDLTADSSDFKLELDHS
uniref:Ubiquitin carboxyl-terminal hydrolase 36 n=1 Tax=Anisakis simplex TaxID=6269 RepID=A0A0M3K324_ANISI